MADTADSSAWVLAIPFALIGVPLLAGGAVLLKRRLRALRYGPLVEAEVVHRQVHRVPVAVQRGPDSSAAPTLTPTFKYRTADGQECYARLVHQTRQRLRSERFRLRYPMGAKVLVRIDPDRPDVAYENSMGWMVVLPSLMVFGGGLITLLALGIYFGS